MSRRCRVSSRLGDFGIDLAPLILDPGLSLLSAAGWPPPILSKLAKLREKRGYPSSSYSYAPVTSAPYLFLNTRRRGIAVTRFAANRTIYVIETEFLVVVRIVSGSAQRHLGAAMRWEDKSLHGNATEGGVEDGELRARLSLEGCASGGNGTCNLSSTAALSTSICSTLATTGAPPYTPSLDPAVCPHPYRTWELGSGDASSKGAIKTTRGKLGESALRGRKMT